jgi:Flp pilus assembly protein TadG
MKRQPAILRQRREGGGIAIVFALMVGILLAAGGLVIDLGHLYVLKSELQNAADSAALGAAKEIDLSASGITKAVTKAKAYAAKHNYDFSTSLVLADSDIWFSNTPDGPWFSPADAASNPKSMGFVKVDTGSKTVDTYLMRVLGTNTVSSTAFAVAGRFVVDVTPLGVCAVDPVNATGRLQVGTTSDYELLEWGFRRGYTYNLLDAASIAGPADAMLINPVDSPPAACNPSNSSANFTAPFLCQGSSAVGSATSGAFSNTGGSTGPTEKAINSRMDSYPGGTQCSTTTAPPDTNIREYDVATGIYSGPWTYTRAVRAEADGAGWKAGSAFAVTDWDNLYGTTQGVTAANKAAYPAAATDTPYTVYTQVPTHTGTAGRRVMNMAIVDCSAYTSGAMACMELPLVGIGRFFLRNKANLAGVGENFSLEYVGMIEPVPNSEIKLYR